MSNLKADEVLFELAKALHELSTAVGSYRFTHWDELKPAERTNLEGLQWTLFNASTDVNAKSVLVKTKLLKDHLDRLQASTAKLSKAAKTIAQYKAAIDLAAKAIALGAAIVVASTTGDLTGIVSAAGALLEDPAKKTSGATA